MHCLQHRYFTTHTSFRIFQTNATMRWVQYTSIQRRETMATILSVIPPLQLPQLDMNALALQLRTRLLDHHVDEASQDLLQTREVVDMDYDVYLTSNVITATYTPNARSSQPNSRNCNLWNCTKSNSATPSRGEWSSNGSTTFFGNENSAPIPGRPLPGEPTSRMCPGNSLNPVMHTVTLSQQLVFQILWY